MRFLWVLAGDADPDPVRLKKLGINGLYFDPRDSKTTKGYLERYFNQGFQVGIYTVWNWPQVDGKTPQEYSEWTRSFLPALDGGRPWFPRVQMDMETHDMSYCEAALRDFRRFRPKRYLSWSLEGMQGGLISDDFARYLNNAKIRVSPQAYTGAMEPLDPEACKDDLYDQQVLFVSPTYDAAALPPDWDGFAFHAGRLP